MTPRPLIVTLVLLTSAACGAAAPPPPPRAAAGSISEGGSPPTSRPSAPDQPSITQPPPQPPPASPPASGSPVENAAPTAPGHQPAPQVVVTREQPARAPLNTPPLPKTATLPAPERKASTATATRATPQATATRESATTMREAPAPKVTVTRDEIPREAAREMRPLPPAKPQQYSGPQTGIIRWAGLVDKDAELTIDGELSSTGAHAGALPGVPVVIQILSKDMVVVQPPSAETRWRRITLRARSLQSSLILQWTVLP